MGKLNRMGLNSVRKNIEDHYTYYLEVLASATKFEVIIYIQGKLHGLGLALGYKYKSIEEDINKAIGDCEIVAYAI